MTKINKDKDCCVCYKEINKKKEKYVKLIDYDGYKEVDHCFYHLSCWLNKFQIVQANIQKQANEWIGKINDMVHGTETVKF